MTIRRVLAAIAITCVTVAPPVASAQPAVDTLHRFSAQFRAAAAPLVEAPDGKLYGVMESGGPTDSGAVFVLTPAGSDSFTFSVLYQFHGLDGRVPNGLIYSAADGLLYGTTLRGGVSGTIFDDVGTVFSLTTAGVLTTLVDFNLDFINPLPIQPAGLVEGSDGNFYGVGASTTGTGSVFKMDRTGVVEVLHTFIGSDGSGPSSVLVEGSDGFLYDTTAFGGANDAGTVYRISKDGNTFTPLYDFGGSPGSAQPRGLLRETSGGADLFYGLTSGGGSDERGSVFTITPAGVFTPFASFGPAPDGAHPVGALVKGPDGLFYGTTESGGPGQLGVVFSVDGGGTIAIVHDFNSDVATGLMTTAGLLRAADGRLYGTTVNGGSHNIGTIFRVDTTAAPQLVEKVTDLPSPGPAFPMNRLLRASDGNLYGTSVLGGDLNRGAIYRVANGVVSIVHSFTFTDGYQPSGDLVEGSDGNLYGTTQYGGAAASPFDFGGGTVFRMSLAGLFTSLHDFTGNANGIQPRAGVVEGPDGNFYGTTSQGGSGLVGTVYKMTPAGVVTTLHEFTGPDGWSPQGGSLVMGHDGYFYGVAREGGSTPTNGVAFKIGLDGDFVLLHEFAFADGAHPMGLLLRPDGTFLGVAESGIPSADTAWGTLFSMTPAGAVTVLHRFRDDVDGAFPIATPVEGGDGVLYGNAWLGGRIGLASGGGTLYQYGASDFTLLHTFESYLTDGGSVNAGLAQGDDNRIYGLTSDSGGTLFAFDAGIANKGPSARSQSVVVGVNGPVNVVVTASDPENDPLTFAVVGGPAHGTLTGTGPAFTYVPAAGFSGQDAFRVRVTDGVVWSGVASVLITVTPASVATTTVVHVNKNPVGALEWVSISAVVSPVAPGGGVPTGRVEFILNGTTVLGSAPVLGGGASIQTTGGVTPGAYAITARYIPDAGFTGSLSAPLTLTVRSLAASTFTILIPWTNPQVLGSPVVVSALVVPLGGGIIPTGTVEFYDTDTLVPLGTATLSSGLATFSWVPTTTGTKTLSAQYVGNASFAPSRSPKAFLTVYTGARPAATTVNLTASPSPGTLGGLVTLTATVGGGVPPGGVVTFFVDGYRLSFAAVVNAGGTIQAQVPTTSLPVGVHVVSASYEPNTLGFAAGNSNIITLVISP